MSEVRQLSLDDYRRSVEALVHQREFKGQTYDPDQDHGRLKAQLHRVKTLMLDGTRRTLRQIADATGDPEASVSARLRDLRRLEHGAYVVQRERVPGARGLFTYQITGTQQKEAA